MFLDSNLAVIASNHNVTSLPIHKKIFCFEDQKNIFSFLRTFSIHPKFKMITKFNDILRIRREIDLSKTHSLNASTFWKWSSTVIDTERHYFPIVWRAHECIYHKRQA